MVGGLPYGISYYLNSSKSANTNNENYHTHNLYEIYMLIDGDINMYIKNSCYHITSSSLAVINSLEPHKFTNNRESKFTRLCFHIPEKFFTDYSLENTELSECFSKRSPGINNIVSLSQSQVNYISGIADHLRKIARNTEESFGERLLFNTYVVQLLIYINNLYKKQSFIQPVKYSFAIQFTIEYIENHFSDKITLDMLADMLSLDKYYLTRKFKKETSTTIFQFLLMTRISKAKQYLLEGMNVTETCFSCGFSNYPNFITEFKKITGYTPKNFQKTMKP